jgi:putative colanic acid biosynthesis acetyltransferase WcaF
MNKSAAALDIAQNRQTRNYSRREMLLRVLWMIGKWTFVLSPRNAFGWRRLILRAFGAHVGEEVNTYPSTDIYFPWNLSIDDWSALGEHTRIYNLGRISIGKRATISQYAHLCAGSHDYTKLALPLQKPEISVGDGVWICADAFVCGGIDIGDGAIVAARAVVTKSVAPWAIVAGNPARKIKERRLTE